MTIEAPPQQSKEIAKKPATLQSMLADIKVKSRFEQMLGKKAAGFMSSIISVSQGNEALQKADPKSIIAAAAMAASLDLPIVSSLGQACIVPYDGQAQFQIMARGYVQLGLRTGQYKTMNATEVYDGEIKSRNRLTGDIELDHKGKKSNKVVGYLFYFRLVNGYEKYTYMTVEECEAHGKKFSKSYNNPKGKWKLDFPVMALKTVVKQGLSKWGPLSTEMQTALEVDQAVITEDGKPEYIDSTATTEGAEEKGYDKPKPIAHDKKEPESDNGGAVDIQVTKLTETIIDGEEMWVIYADKEKHHTGFKAIAEMADKALEQGQTLRVVESDRVTKERGTIKYVVTAELVKA